jgi:PPOX class probable F420-dependent enzyme
MAADRLPDPDTDFGRMARERLAGDPLIWFTTIGRDGTPQPNPVWFLLEDDEILVYNTPKVNRVNHIKARPQVSLNLNSDADGNGIVVITGLARVVPDAPPADEHPAYMAKYAERAARISGDATAFARNYSVAVRVAITKVRGF